MEIQEVVQAPVEIKDVDPQLSCQIKYENKYKKIFFLAVILLLGLSGFFVYQYLQKDPVIYEKEERSGACLDRKGTCSQLVTLHSSGRMILQGKQNLEKQVSNTQIVEFKDYVKNTGLLNKKCKEINDAAMDYFAVYHLKLFNKKKGNLLSILRIRYSFARSNNRCSK
jgi:hypothetical protein